MDHYRDLSRFANDPIFLIDEDGFIREANDRACEVYGFTRRELFELRINDLRAPHTLPMFKRDWATCGTLEGGIFETVHRRKDGSEFEVEVSAKLIPLNGGMFRQSIVRDVSARKQAESKLTKAEEMIRLLADNLKEMVLAFGMDRRLTFANPALETLTGFTKEEFDKLAFASWVHPGDFERMVARYSEAFRGASFQDEEYRILGRDGVAKWASATWNPIIDINGRQIGVQAVERDISAKKRMGEVLRAKERRYRCLFNSITDAVFVNLIDAKGQTSKFVELNDVACQKLGYTREELLEMKPWQIVAPELLPLLPQLIPRIQSEGYLAWQGVAIAKDGHRIPIELRHRTFDLDGEPAVLTAVHDISDRCDAERQSKLNMEKYSKVVRNAPLGILILIGQTIRFANPEALRMFAAARECDLLGTPMGQRITAEHRGPCLEQLASIACGSLASYCCEGKWLRLNQSPLTAMVTAVPYEEGDEKGALIFLSDISEMRQAQADKEALHAQFLQAQKMESVGRLAGGVAHDFNNLLTVINGYSALALSRLPEGDAAREPMGEILKAGKQAAQLTKQLLAFSRRQVFEPRALDINHCVLDMLKMLQRLVGDHIRIDVRLCADAATVWADSGQLQQVLMNLAVNARDSMPDGGVLTISSENRIVGQVRPSDQIEINPGEYVLLSVSDTGCGMDEETRQRIFEPFFTTKKEGKGTGLGLSTVYGIVRQCGGWISVQSRIEDGSRFDIFLPRRSGHVVEAAAPKMEPRTAGMPVTVLVVEDSQSVRQTVVELVEYCGYSALQADGGATALELAKGHEGSIHVLLTDVQMPGMNGPELAAALRRIRPDVRVIFMSGYAEALVPPGQVLPTACTYLQKPFTPEDLAWKIGEALHSKPASARLLVVDDDEAVRMLFQEILQGAGFTVETAATGREALRAIHERGFDVVLTDLVMPDKDGIEAIQAIRHDFPQQYIIAVSGAFNGMFLRPAEIMGAQRSLLKPVSPDALLDAVREALA